MIGLPVEYAIETAAPTLLSIASNFVSTIPSIVRGGSTTAYLCCRGGGGGGERAPCGMRR
jgi:hypothetical protein